MQRCARVVSSTFFWGETIIMVDLGGTDLSLLLDNGILAINKAQ